MYKTVVGLALLGLHSLSAAKYGDLVDHDASSGFDGWILFLALCIGGYLWYRREERERDARIAQREREEALREEVQKLKQQ